MRFLILIFMMGSFFANAQKSKSQVILDNLTKKMKNEKAFYIEFSANIKNSVTGLNENETGKGWVNEKKFYASYGDNTMISNGTKVWTIVKEEKMVYLSSIGSDEEEMNPKKLMTIWENGYFNKYLKESKLNNTPVHLIKLTPKSKDSEYSSIVLAISKKNNALKKVKLKTDDGTTMTYSLMKYNSKPSISNEKFIYNAKKYPGYKLIRD
ncbi:MAG: outer membrane lipoprotein carrier protein LolA [Crocinitomicaceae bacterium]|nr:outer membrane lipoprotein carrier protein LolA [Crocinitomicaceae bacterium]